MTLETATISKKWVEIADSLPSDRARGRFYSAIVRYAIYDEEPHFIEGFLQAYFTLIKPSIDKSKKRRYAQQISLQNRLQNRLQNVLQNDSQNGLQTDQQTDQQNGLQSSCKTVAKQLQNRLQNDQQTDHSRALNTVTETSLGVDRKREKTEIETEKKRIKEKRETETEKNVCSVAPKKVLSFADSLPPHLLTDAVKAKWQEWEAYRRSRRKPISQSAFSLMRTMLEKLSPEEAIESINQSIASDWQGLFPPKTIGQHITTPAQRKDISGI